jgi:hypothetical protein
LPTTTVVNQNYYGSISVIGGVAPYNWSVNWKTSNDNLNWNTGADGSSLIINGTPNQTGTITFQAEVSDSTGASSGWQTYTITVNPYVTGYWPVYGQISFNGCGSGNNPPVTLTLTSTGGGGITQTTVSDSMECTSSPACPTEVHHYSFDHRAGKFLLLARLAARDRGELLRQRQQLQRNRGLYGLRHGGLRRSKVRADLPGDERLLSPTPGTAILAPGAFTIHGVPPGVYTFKAWMDNLGMARTESLQPAGQNLQRGGSQRQQRESHHRV